jgi:aerobic carbon-monoxide dehydrogenase large subunit
VSPGLEASETFVSDAMAYANGTAVAAVEVDPETGFVAIERLVIAHDCGRMLNPMIVDGQILGGAAHGIGNALLEWMGFDDEGQPVTANFGEYLLPCAPLVPPVTVLHHESPSPLNPLGVKGVGECGVMPVPAALVSAIEDALSPFGVRIDQAPIRPHEIVALINRSRSSP